jgi:hypothetical protein
VGGDYANTALPFRVAAYSLDRGVTWKLAEHAPEGFRSAIEVVDDRTWIAVGPTGEDISTDQGIHWKHSASLNLNAIFVLDDRTIFAVGPKGTVAEYDILYEIRYGVPNVEPATGEVEALVLPDVAEEDRSFVRIAGFGMKVLRRTFAF